MSFLCHCYLRKRLFLHIPVNLMEFFDASTAIAPKKSIRQPKRKKKKRRKQKRINEVIVIMGFLMSHSEKSRYSSKDIISLDELIV